MQRLEAEAQQAMNSLKLADLLGIPTAFNAFLNFCAAEFASENVLFYKRVKVLSLPLHAHCNVA
jgi:hypothetical protein